MENYTIILKGMISSLFVTLVAIFAPIVSLMLLVGLAIALDTFSGLWKAYKTDEEITSRKMNGAIIKMVLYQSAIILFYLVDLYILKGAFSVLSGQPILLTKLIACWLVVTEIKSLNENYLAVTGKDIIKNTAQSIKGIRNFYSEIIKK